MFPDDVRRVEWVCDRVRLMGEGLDLGCADGLLIARLLLVNPDATALAVDVDRSREEEVSRHADLLGVGHRLFFASTWERCPSEVLTWVTCFEVLEHQETEEAAEKLVSDLATRLAPRGVAYFSVPNRWCADPARQRWDYPTHRLYFSKDLLTGLLTHHFRYVSVRSIVDDIWLYAECMKSANPRSLSGIT